VEVWLHLFLNSAPYKGREQLHAAVGLSPAKDPSVPIVQKAGWAQDLGCALWKRWKFVAYAGDPTRIPRLFNHYTY
jgi:hypothetical protein